MAGLREQKKKATRAAIMEAAITLFGERGYENTSISALAKAAGVGKGTIYSYFKSKNEILLGFCEEEMTYIHKKIKGEMDPDAPLLDKILLLFMSEFRYVTKNKEFGRTLMREMVFPREITIEKSRKVEGQFINLFISIAKEAQEKGQLRADADLFLTCGHFYALYLLAVSVWYSERLHNLEDVRSMLEVMFDQAVSGLRPSDQQNHRRQQTEQLVQKLVHNHEPGLERQSVTKEVK
ncbi:MAG: TetR/AcrR family transcriptional regulator [Candidatus Electrothrix sp. AR4]|nr:TetR/AcrR family transcriptional regulator [Candidatus Electrothrix sp. AR4]